MVKILMMSAKMATPGLLKITVFWNNDYDVKIPVDDITNKISSHDSNYIVDLFMWPKPGNSSISIYERSYNNLNFIKIWPDKPHFLRGGLDWSSVIWDWH